MMIPPNIIANADDFGLSHAVNNAILHCYEEGIINSTSLMVNTGFFEDTVELIHQKPQIKNIGVHVNLAEGKPITNFNQTKFLDENGNWDFKKVNQKYSFLNTDAKAAFLKEIQAQVDRALSKKISISHIDSHCHLHTLPCYYKLYLTVATQYKLKLRLAQTYNEGNYLKFFLRKYINLTFKKEGHNYSDYFETVGKFLSHLNIVRPEKHIEIMLHPYFDTNGILKDHYDEATMADWMNYLSSAS